MWSRGSVALGVFTSLVLHGAWLANLRTPAAERVPSAGPATAPYEVPVAALFTSPSASQARVQPSEVVPGGPESESALDLDALSGRGGSDASDARSMLLFSFVSPLSLQDTDLNNLRRNQTQRIATSPLRATQEERRATPNPASAVFLASGLRGHRERRDPAPRDAQPGALAEGLRPRAVDVLGARAEGLGDTRPASKRDAQRAVTEAPRGIRRGAGRAPELSAKVQFARPNVDRGPAATPAEARDAKVRDNVDAELLAAALQRSIVDASTQRAALRAEGVGGAHEGAGLSREGEGRGAQARPYLPGAGNDSALSTEEARYVRWFTEQKERVQSELVFPAPRALSMDQGTSIYRVIVRRDGRLAAAPRLVRSSGFSDFDEAAVAAIRRALPFSPLPEQLLPDDQDLALLIPVAFSNPMVQ